MRARAFTLVELLVVIAIIAILGAMLMPVFKQMRSAAYQFVAINTAGQLGRAESMYASDNDETHMLAMYATDEGLQAWFGRYNDARFFDPTYGVLYQYTKRRVLKDQTASDYKEYLGDHSGWGYNWGYIGSDFSVVGNYWGYPNCQNAATTTAIEHPSTTILFSSAAYYNAPWYPNGDGKVYDFGFVDPPKFWNGNPNMDFRHLGTRSVDAKSRLVTQNGNAVVAYTDGHSGQLKTKQVTDAMFERGNPQASGSGDF